MLAWHLKTVPYLPYLISWAPISATGVCVYHSQGSGMYILGSLPLLITVIALNCLFSSLPMKWEPFTLIKCRLHARLLWFPSFRQDGSSLQHSDLSVVAIFLSYSLTLYFNNGYVLLAFGGNGLSVEGGCLSSCSISGVHPFLYSTFLLPSPHSLIHTFIDIKWLWCATGAEQSGFSPPGVHCVFYTVNWGTIYTAAS